MVPLLPALAFFLVPTPANACLPPSIGFARGSVAIHVGPRDEINRIADAFKASPRGSRIALEAVGDTTGSEAINRRMSQRRGDAVRAALVRRGVPDGAIDIQISQASNGWYREVVMTINTRPGCV
jgi:outer membrane protein OmpA-like peptidoglycan-associated protein